MPTITLPLTSGAYSAQSLLASAQRCVNLYPEKNPEGVKPVMPTAHYARPGLTLLRQAPVQGPGRCLYRANNGDLYAVIGQLVYYINPDWVFTLLGQLQTVLMTPVIMSDNGQEAIIVDGSMLGYQIQFGQRTFSEISDQNFSGSNGADFIDSFIVLNKPGTNQWYSTLSDQIAFNALFVGIKTAWPDNILRIITVEREVWVFGPLKSEVWYNAGAVPFPFQILPGNIIEQGCAAIYSPAKMDTNVYWLSQSPEGDRMVMRGNSQNVAQRISTHAIEAEWRTYPRIDDAIGATYQLQGHSFYKLHFPTADKTWGYDEATQQWHEDAWIDNNGVFHRARNTFCAFAYGKNVALDWATGALYQIDPNVTNDNGQPIAWVRSFPHIVDALKRVNITSFVADVETGKSVNTGDPLTFTSPWSGGFSSGFGPLVLSATDVPQLAMRLSKDGGHNFLSNRIKTLASSGHYRTLQRWRGNGIVRDAVFELSSTAEMIPSLNGAYVDLIEGQT